MADATNPNLAGVTVPAAADSSADPLNRVADLNRSWNFRIPAAWTTQNLDVFVTLNSGNYNPLPNVPSVPECQSVIVGECGDNNEITLHLAFTPVKTVVIDPVLVRLKGAFDGSAVDVTATSADALMAWRTVNQLYPMTAQLGTTRSLTEDPNKDDGDILSDVQGRFACGASWIACGFGAHFILALIPHDRQYAALKAASGLSNRGDGAFWAAAPPAVFDSNDRYSQAIVHEMGHAIGFKHASCDHGESNTIVGIFTGTRCDDTYPIQHGGIGGYGFNFSSWTVIPPGIADGTHPHSHDFMTYGLPFWVSTYMWDITTDDSYVDTVSYRDCTFLGIPIPFTNCGVDHAHPRPRR